MMPEGSQNSQNSNPQVSFDHSEAENSTGTLENETENTSIHSEQSEENVQHDINQSDVSNHTGRKRKQNRKWIPKSVYRRQKRKSLKKKINLVHNFSSIELSEAAVSVLNKGLNFCPAQKGVNYTQLLADLFRLERKMAWTHHFRDEEKEDSSEVKKKFPFTDKKQKTNLPPEYPKEISEFINSVRSDLIGSKRKSKFSNLTADEWRALDELNN